MSTDRWGYEVHDNEPEQSEWSVPSPPTRAEREQEKLDESIVALRSALRHILSAAEPIRSDEPGLIWGYKITKGQWQKFLAMEAVKDAMKGEG